MWQAALLGVLGGFMGGNAFPHFVHGITKKNYQNVMGDGPIPNIIGGWAGLVLAVLVIHWAHSYGHPALSFSAMAVGVLLIGLFHAGPGAFGRPSHKSEDTNLDR